MESDNTVTRLLHAWNANDTESLSQLIPLVYAELHTLAVRQMARETDGHTLQPTALVHEAFLRLSGSSVSYTDRVHFFALAASTMRRVLVDHARTRGRSKRGNAARLLPLEEGQHVAADDSDAILDLDESLERLAGVDERKARVVELHYFGGLKYDEIAGTLGISEATVDRDLRFARAWLYSDLQSATTTKS